MNLHDEDPLMIQESIEQWVMNKCDDWRNHYEQNYKEKHQEYYRLWRGIWDSQDKTRKSERSKIIAPALQQAVESSVAEVEEATFGRGSWFDIEDDMLDQKRDDVEYLKKKLAEDFKFANIRKGISESVINAAVFGTGIAEIIVEETKEMVPASEPIMDGNLRAIGVNISDRTVVRLRPVLPQNFLIDPAATSIEEALGCAIDEYVPTHQVELLQEQGVYKRVPLGMASPDDALEADSELSTKTDDKIRLTKYHGLVPSHLLEDGDKDSAYTEAIVVVGNGGVLLKATSNKNMMKDRNVIAFSWDVVPSRFWGRGVCEKGYNSQKALDAEIRARIDALALTVHPMLAMDATRIPRGTKPEVRAGKILLTNGDPKDVLNPFNFGNVSQITFAQAAALQDMVQQATGAVDTAGLAGVVSGDAKAGAVSMSLGAILKRHKRTLLNFQDNFLIPFVSKAAWRYMQYEPDLYPVADFKFTASSTLGIMAREYEVTQLVQLLQTMGQDTPIYGLLVQSIIENMNISNREQLIQQIANASKPDPQQQQMEQQRIQAELALQAANVKLYESQAAENTAQAQKYQAETQAVPAKLELEKLKLATHNLKEGYEDDKEFTHRLKIAELALKEKELDLKTSERDQMSKFLDG